MTSSIRPAPTEGSFRDWINRTKVTNDPIGDLIGDFKADKRAPDGFESIDRLRLYLAVRDACPEAIKAAGVRIPTKSPGYNGMMSRGIPE